MNLYATLKSIRLPRYEHLYVMWSMDDLRFKAKVGISQDGHTRRNDVQASVSAVTGKKIQLYCFRLPVLLPRKNEAIAHRMLRRFKYDGLHGSSGYSEWFYCFNVVAFLIIWIGLYLNGVSEPMWKAGYVFFLQVPLDFFMVVIMLAAAQYAVVIGVIYGLFYFAFA